MREAGGGDERGERQDGHHQEEARLPGRHERMVGVMLLCVDAELHQLDRGERHNELPLTGEHGAQRAHEAHPDEVTPEIQETGCGGRCDRRGGGIRVGGHWKVSAANISRKSELLQGDMLKADKRNIR